MQTDIDEFQRDRNMNAEEEEESEDEPLSPVLNRHSRSPIRPRPDIPGQFSVAFSTARGNAIAVSAKAIQAAKSKMAAEAITEEQKSDSEFEPSSSLIKENVVPQAKAVNPSGNVSGFTVGFSTAGGSAISVSSKAVEAAKSKIAEDIIPVEEESDSDSEPLSPIIKRSSSIAPQSKAFIPPASAKSLSVAFSTARGNAISVSAKAIQAAKSKMAEEAIAEEPVLDSDIGPRSSIIKGTATSQTESVNPSGNASSFSVAFSTARGNAISVSAKAIQAAKSKMAEESNTEEQVSDSNQRPPISKQNITRPSKAFNLPGTSNSFQVAFSTARGNAISVSAKAIQAAKSKMAAETISEEQVSDSDAEPHSSITKRNITPETETVNPCGDASRFPVAFATARGSTISVSAKAILAAKSKMAEETITEEPMSDSDPEPRSSTIKQKTSLETDPFNLPGNANNFSVAFSTAGGSAITVSKKAIQAAKSKMEVDTTTEEQGFDSDFGPRSSIVKGDATPHTEAINPPGNASSFAVGFSTAGGSAISVSAKAIQAAKSMIAEDNKTDDEVSDSDSEPLSPIIKRNVPQSENFNPPGNRFPVSFSTGGGKVVPVSTAALEAAKTKIALDSTSTTKQKTNSNAAPQSPSSSFTTKTPENEDKVSITINAGLRTFLSPEESLEVAEISRIFLDDTIVSDDDSEWLENSVMQNTLRSVKSDATTIPELKVVVVRIYPLLFTCTPKIGQRLYLNREAFCYYELQNAQRKEELRDKLMPDVDQKVRKSLIPKPPKGYAKLKSSDMSTDDLLGIMFSSEDGANDEVVKSLSLHQKRELEEASIKLRDKISVAVQQELLEQMKSSGVCDSTSNVLKVRVMDVDSYDTSDATVPARNAVVSIWKPKLDVVESLKETNVYELHHLKYTGLQNDSALRFSTTKETQINPTDMSLMSTQYSRKYTAISEILSLLEDFKPPFAEFDTVGRIVEVSNYTTNSGLFVHLADENQNILKLKFWNSLKAAGFEDVIKVGRVVACYNLEWRMSSPKTETAFVQDVTIFSTHPKQDHLSDAFDALKRANELLPVVETSAPKTEENITPIRTSSKRALFVDPNDEPPELPPIANAGPAKRRRLSNSKFVPPRRVSPKQPD